MACVMDRAMQCTLLPSLLRHAMPNLAAVLAACDTTADIPFPIISGRPCRCMLSLAQQLWMWRWPQASATHSACCKLLVLVQALAVCRWTLAALRGSTRAIVAETVALRLRLLQVACSAEEAKPAHVDDDGLPPRRHVHLLR